MKLSVIIPAYNEIETISEIVARVRAVNLDVKIWADQAHEKTETLEREVIIVDDGSVDGTRGILQVLQEQPDIQVIFHKSR